MTITPTMPIVLFRLAATLSRPDVPQPVDVEVNVTAGQVRLSLTLAAVDDLRWWARHCGDSHEQSIRATPYDVDGVPHSLTTALGEFAGVLAHLSTTGPTGGTP